MELLSAGESASILWCPHDNSTVSSCIIFYDYLSVAFASRVCVNTCAAFNKDCQQQQNNKRDFCSGFSFFWLFFWRVGEWRKGGGIV